MADAYDKAISRWEGEGGFASSEVPREPEWIEPAPACSVCEQGFWLKALVVAGVAALAIYALASRNSR